MNTHFTDPQLILVNGKIWSANRASQNSPTALAVSGDRIIAVGSDRDMLSLKKRNTRIIDARGNWILPGLMDAHTHLSLYAARKLQIDLTDCTTLPEALHRIRERVEQADPGSWIVGGGWDYTRWGLEDFPDKRLLDEISTRHFIALQSKDWHSLWVNSAVLQLCRIDETVEDPPGGAIRRYPGSREPSGVLQERAGEVVYQSIAPPTLEEIYPALQETFGEFLRLGITGVHSVESPYEFAHYRQLYERGELGLRVFWYFPIRFLGREAEEGFGAYRGDHFLKICGVKMFADGALGSQTAEMLEPYQGLEHRGVAVMSAEELEEHIRRSVEQRLACAVHAIGDAANRKVLRALGKVAQTSRKAGLRHRIEHAQLLHPDDIPLFARYGVIASMQPMHLAYDVPLIERYWGSRGRHAYAWGSLRKSGARLIFGSDTPIETFDPWKGLYAAVARKPGNDPAQPSFYPEESIPVEEALAAYTHHSAHAVGEEAHLGSLEPGKLADFIAIDRDIFQAPSEILLDTSVLLTVRNGTIAYASEDGLIL